MRFRSNDHGSSSAGRPEARFVLRHPTDSGLTCTQDIHSCSTPPMESPARFRDQRLTDGASEAPAEVASYLIKQRPRTGHASVDVAERLHSDLMINDTRPAQ